MITGRQLIEWARDARQRTLELVADLTDTQLIGPRLPTVNPLLWELGHVAWFQEKWQLRRSTAAEAARPDADALYDSAAVAHATRWDLPLPDRVQTLRYLSEVLDRIVERLGRPLDHHDVYFALLTIFHEDMHAEAFTLTRQTLGYPAPRLSVVASNDSQPAMRRSPQANETSAREAPSRTDSEIPGGLFHLGAERGEPFVFDNEKWAHALQVKPFSIARLAVTQAEFAAFVDEGGYRERRFWTEAGWKWRGEAEAHHPVYWRREAAGRWLRRDFDRWVTLEPDRPMMHVNWFEADAYCRWAGRRLPGEAEWESAASAISSLGGGFTSSKRRFPWGDERPTSRDANLDGRAMGCINVNRLPDGDSAFGCRQMIGNVWEWTADTFLPYPGFVPDPYKEYSAPWFGTHKVLRGGCWATRSRLLRNTWRNFYRPDRRDVWAGFRTCALGE